MNAPAIHPRISEALKLLDAARLALTQAGCRVGTTEGKEAIQRAHATATHARNDVLHCLGYGPLEWAEMQMRVRPCGSAFDA